MPNYKVVDADVLDADLQTVADAIKAKAGTEEALEFPSGFASAVESIETGGGGDTTIEDGLITGTLTEYTNDRVESVRKHAFRSYSAVKTISIPKVSGSIPMYTFDSCTNLEAIIIGDITDVENYAFNSCEKLKNIDLSKVTEVGNYAFQRCKALEEIDIPLATSAGIYAFAYAMQNGGTVNAPKLKNIGSSTFYFCGMTQLNAPLVTTITSSGLSNCKNLKSLDFPLLQHIDSSGVFYACSALKTLTLRINEVCPLSGVYSFQSTPFYTGGTGGVVIVPSALIETYQTATNWSTLYAAGTCTFLPLEEYTLDGTTTGEIDMAKVEAKLNELYGGATA